MANPTRKEYPVRKYVGFSDEQWKPLRRWIKAQRPKISEAEGLRRLAGKGLWISTAPEGHEKRVTVTRKRAEPSGKLRSADQAGEHREGEG